MHTLKDERSDSIETNDELPIQFDNILRDFSVNMTFTLPSNFKAKKVQSLVMHRDVEGNEGPMVVIVEEKDEPRGTPSLKPELGKFPIESLEKKTKIMEHSKYGSRAIILRPKKEHDSGKNKPIIGILQRS